MNSYEPTQTSVTLSREPPAGPWSAFSIQSVRKVRPNRYAGKARTASTPGRRASCGKAGGHGAVRQVQRHEVRPPAFGQPGQEAVPGVAGRGGQVGAGPPNVRQSPARRG